MFSILLHIAFHAKWICKSLNGRNVAYLVPNTEFIFLLTYLVFCIVSFYISMGQLSSFLAVAEFTETWEVRTSALQAVKEDVMATNQQVKTQRSAAIKQLPLNRRGIQSNARGVFFSISLKLTTSYINDFSYLKQKKLSVKKRHLLDA